MRGKYTENYTLVDALKIRTLAGGLMPFSGSLIDGSRSSGSAITSPNVTRPNRLRSHLKTLGKRY
jgi:hypothetical protein